MHHTDQDDLFRKAAENYSLKRGRDRWEEIASQLEKPFQQVSTSKNRSYKKYTAMILFLFAFLFLADFFSRNDENMSLDYQNGKHDPAKKDVDQLSDTNKKASRPELSNHPYIIERKLNQVPEPSNQTDHAGPGIGQEIYSVSITPFDGGIENGAVIPAKNEQAAVTIEPLNIQPGNMQLKTSTRIALQDPGTVKMQGRRNTMHGLYFGLTGGTGITNIKNQEMSKTGFEYGFITGWRFSTRLSAETGLLYSNKNYQTSGKYFSLETIGSTMPPDMKIMDVKSISHLLQIPIHVRYDVLHKNKHRIFTSAGFSSYVLFKEDNSYHTMQNGTEAMMYSTYKNKRSYFAGSFDISIGYEKQLGTKSSLRVNPYVQLPLKGMGVGDLQLKTAGLRIALTRSAN